jgi:hypothetical protein
MKKFNELVPLIQDWAKAKNINNKDRQKLKFIEEFGELTGAYLKNNEPLKKDGLGDSIVTVIVLAGIINRPIKLDKPNWYKENESDFYSTYWGIIEDINSERVNVALQGLIHLSYFMELDYLECLNIAWYEIKNRTGKTINGSFVRDK